MANSSYPDFVGDTLILDQAFERIAEAIRSRDAQFLFGAGMSADSGVPTGKGLLQMLLKKFFPVSGDDPPSDEERNRLAGLFPFEAVVEAVQGIPGRKREDLTKCLKQIFVEKAHEPTTAHHDFLSAWHWGGQASSPVVFTTNFDFLLEKAFGESRAISITDASARELRKATREGKVCVVHLHGLLEDGDYKYKITESDIYSTRYDSLAGELRSALTTADAFVFVGYSLNDPDFRSLYMDYRDEIINRKRLDKTTYVVSPACSKHEYRLGQAVWASRGAVWIPLAASAFFAKLKDIVESSLNNAVQSSVMRKYDLKDEQALQQLRGRVAKLLRIDKDEALLFLHEVKRPGGGAK